MQIPENIHRLRLEEAPIKPRTVFILILFLGGSLALTACRGVGSAPGFIQSQTGTDFFPPDMGCSVIYVADGEVALGGNNEDYWNPFTMAWFLPPEDGKFGRVYFGYEGFLWGGGMNDQGLFFDAMAVDEPIQVDRAGKPTYDGSLPDKVMAECDSVDCVIEMFSQYHSYDTWYHQFLFGDAYGNSVIVEPLTFLRNEAPYQVATNFYQSRVYIPTCNTCTRYLTATSMFEKAETYSVELIRDILDAVHFETGSPTLYSNVYDLKTRTVYLYFFHDFQNPVVFQLEDELAKGKHAVYLATLFPENQAYLEWARPEMDRVAEIRAVYPQFEGDPSNYVTFTGKYALPTEMGLPYPYYTIALEDGTLFLKIYPDKGWLALTAQSETSFYHISSFSHFEITFLPDENGQVNQFLYTEEGSEYTFTRLDGEILAQDTALQTTDLTPTAAPSNTPEPQQPTLTPLEKQPTANTDLPTPTPTLQSSRSYLSWWIYLVLIMVLIAGWYLIRRKT